MRAPVEFAVCLKAYVDEVTGACPLCDHRDHEEWSEDENVTAQ
jgi:hypothetical protein